MFIITRGLSLKLREKVVTHKPVFLFYQFLLILLILLIIYSVLFKGIEGGVTWVDATFQSWQTFSTVGYGDGPAKTEIGKITTMVIGTIGIFALGVVFSLYGDMREHFRSRRLTGMSKNKDKDFIMIVGFHEESVLEAIEELRLADPNIKFCIVDENVDELPISIRVLPNIFFIKGHLLGNDTYDRANLKCAKVCIVLPKDNTILGDCTTKAVTEFIEELRPDIRMIYLLNNANNRKLFKENGKVSILRSSWVKLLSQECTDRYSSRVIEQVTTNKHGENIATVKPKHYVGAQWLDLAIDAASYDKSFTPIALIRDGKVQAPPHRNLVLKENDLISIIKTEEFDWEEFDSYYLSKGVS